MLKLICNISSELEVKGITGHNVFEIARDYLCMALLIAIAQTIAKLCILLTNACELSVLTNALTCLTIAKHALQLHVHTLLPLCEVAV